MNASEGMPPEPFRILDSQFRVCLAWPICLTPWVKEPEEVWTRKDPLFYNFYPPHFSYFRMKFVIKSKRPLTALPHLYVSTDDYIQVMMTISLLIWK